jgi:hypothetical protein
MRAETQVVVKLSRFNSLTLTHEAEPSWEAANSAAT